MTYLLETANEHIEKAVMYESQGNPERAKHHYLKASEYLFNAAKESSGKLKQVRMENAEKLLNISNSIEIRTKETRIKEQPVGKGEEAEETDISEWIVSERPNVRFDDVAGLEDVKKEIMVKVVYPRLHPEKAEEYGVKKGGGILLYGPPGTGKTYISKAIANEVNAVFFSIIPSDIMSQWVGVAEQNIAKLFNVARKHDNSVIFIDEVEALIPKRHDSHSTVMKRVVPQILAEMDGLETKNENLLFVGATNEPWSLDRAALRPGRFDEKIYVPPPDSEARKKIFQLNLKGKPLSDNIDLDEATKLSEGYSAADIRYICVKASTIPFIESIETGNERKIEMKDLSDVMTKIKPSISKEMVEKYKNFEF